MRRIKIFFAVLALAGSGLLLSAQLAPVQAAGDKPAKAKAARAKNARTWELKCRKRAVDYFALCIT